MEKPERTGGEVRLERTVGREPAAWETDQGIVVREDIKNIFGWEGAWVGMGRAYPDAWVPFLFT